jgi:hypothetical protein
MEMKKEIFETIMICLIFMLMVLFTPCRGQAQTGEVIGKWDCVYNSVIKSKVTIHKEGGKYFLTEKVVGAGKSGTVGEVIKRQAKSGTRWDYVRDVSVTQSGDYFILISNGKLQRWDNHGIIHTCTQCVKEPK